MLKVHIPDQEIWDEQNEIFIHLKSIDLQLEHSLISLKKWEQKWHKPFLGKEEKTEEQIKDYIRCMTLTQNINPEIYKYLPADIFQKILDYIDDPMTATWFSDVDKKQGIGRREVVTAEIIYYWMITLNIPVEFQKWHLNQLLTLIRVINAKNAAPKKMSKKDIFARNAKLNAARRAKHKTKG